MPSYDYHCPTNGQVVEVRHRMSESCDTWGDICARTGLDLGDTPADAPVERYVSATSLGGTSGSSGGFTSAAPARSCGVGGFT